MLKRVVFVLLVGLMSSFTTTSRLVKTKIADDIVVSLPKDFRPMDDLDFSQRYPSVRKPIAAYTNPDRDVDFSVNISATQWSESDVEIAQKFFKAGILNMFDGVEMINEGIQTLSGKKFIFFEFESRIKGERMKQELRDPVLGYTYIQYRIEKGRTLVFSFNCPRRLREDWEGTAQKIMKSVKMK
jgi:hypothetical protein